MKTVLREYDAHIDSKKRLTLRSALYEYYHVSELSDGRIVLEPRELVPVSVSGNTQQMMDTAVENFKAGKVSEEIDLSELGD